MMIEADRDLIFGLAERVIRALNMIQRNADFDRVAEETNLDLRFVIAMAVLSASEAVSA